MLPNYILGKYYVLHHASEFVCVCNIMFILGYLVSKFHLDDGVVISSHDICAFYLLELLICCVRLGLGFVTFVCVIYVWLIH